MSFRNHSLFWPVLFLSGFSGVAVTWFYFLKVKQKQRQSLQEEMLHKINELIHDSFEKLFMVIYNLHMEEVMKIFRPVTVYGLALEHKEDWPEMPEEVSYEDALRTMNSFHFKLFRRIFVDLCCKEGIVFEPEYLDIVPVGLVDASMTKIFSLLDGYNCGCGDTLCSIGLLIDVDTKSIRLQGCKNVAAVVCSKTNVPCLERLHCTNCENLVFIPPILPSLVSLDCFKCPKLMRVNSYPILLSLNCSFCPKLTLLPQMDLLRELNCNSCTNLMAIQNYPNLEYLNCDDCDCISSIVGCNKLNNLICNRCPMLRNIPSGKFNLLEFNDTPLLYLPLKSNLFQKTLNFTKRSSAYRNGLPRYALSSFILAKTLVYLRHRG